MGYRFWAVKLEEKKIFVSSATIVQQIIMHPAVKIYVKVEMTIDGKSSSRLYLLQWRLIVIPDALQTLSAVERVFEGVRLRPPHCLHRGHASASSFARTVVRRHSPATQCAQAISSAPCLSATGKVPPPTPTSPG